MRFEQFFIAGAAYLSAVSAASLADVCTVAHVQASLPSNGTFPGISLDLASVAVIPVYDASNTAQTFFPAAAYNYCNITLSYSHNARGDIVHLQYWFPIP